ncbi:hypothetical protein ACHHV8_27970 [Paenibacillus sp. TAB 01]|uniref:hypothetical protein n=1 Tax=Paenibacillus sp. TAB 01 TaxID=3368988 RepID=UPI003753B336
MVKLIVFIALLLMYPLFLRWIHISDLRVVPLVVPYALGVLSITILVSNIAEFFIKKWKKE